MSIADVGFVVLLGLFGVWGWLRGIARQALALAFVVVALFVAGKFGTGLEDAVAKVVTLGEHERCVVAWFAAFLGTLLVGAAVQSFLRRGKEKVASARAVAAALGVVKGVLVLVVGTYALLGWYGGAGRPAFVESVERSLSARAVHWTAERLRTWVPTPPCIAHELDRAGERMAGP